MATYCDTSVIVGYYVPEVHSQAIQQALATLEQRYVSSLTMTEASAALRRKVHDGVLPRDDALAAWDGFRRDVGDGVFRFIDLDRRHHDHAAALLWKIDGHLRTLDALHVAVADLEGMRLLSADLQMVTVAEGLQMRVTRIA